MIAVDSEGEERPFRILGAKPIYWIALLIAILFRIFIY